MRVGFSALIAAGSLGIGLALATAIFFADVVGVRASRGVGRQVGNGRDNLVCCKSANQFKSTVNKVLKGKSPGTNRFRPNNPGYYA